MIEAGTPRPAPARTDASSASRAWRMSPRLRKLVLAAHVLVGVGWFGVVLAKLVLEVTAVTTRDPAVPRVAYQLMLSLDRVTFPPLAVATLLTGVVLSVGTAWGLFQHYWIVAKLVLTVAVVVTGILFVGAWTQQAIAQSSAPDGVMGSVAGSAPTLLLGAAVAHALMLGTTTVISVYKPWGQIRSDRHVGAQRGARPGTREAR